MAITRENICLTVAYDGTDFHGFQRQANAPSIQQYLEESLTQLLHTPIRIYGAARTDAGVHAYGQVVNFYGTLPMPVERLPFALRAYLPPTIVVRTAQIMPEMFSVRHDNCGKYYRYRIINASYNDPLQLRYGWHIRKPLDLQRMQEGAEILRGTHDFTSFEGKNTTPMNPVKTMYAITFTQEKENVDIHVIGSGFLYHMVRNMVGGFIDLGLHRFTTMKFRRILNMLDRTALGATAPAHGLYLEEVFYNTTRRQLIIENVRQGIVR